jgi:hypothetical protein
VKFNKLNLNYESFQLLNKHEHLKNPLDMQIHIVYIQHNLRFLVQTLFDSLYNHPKASSLKHLLDKLVHIVYTQCTYTG